MEKPIALCVIIWLHFIGDFVLQSRHVANNKSKNINILTIHCIIYMIPFIILGWRFAIFAGLTHFPIDYITSKLTTYFNKQKRSKAFFTTIGIDQSIHFTILIFGSYHYFPKLFG